MSKSERTNVPGRICIMSAKSVNVLIIAAIDAVLRFDGFFVRNNTIEIIRKIKNKIARIFPSNAIVKPFFPPSVGGNQGRKVKTRTARLTPIADLRNRSSFSLEKEE